MNGGAVLVTGANGFVGRVLVRHLRERGVTRVVGAVRTRSTPVAAGVEAVAVGDLGLNTRWDAALQGVHTVIHLAARVHVMRDTAADPLAEFRRVNLDATMALARQAADAGVARLVFVSSVKVNGDAGRFVETDAAAPDDPYGISKWEAERALQALGRERGLEIVIVRPPLVYGPGVKGNFRALMQAVRRGVPLPFALVRNQRSLVAVDTLADFLCVCGTHPRAANETFFVNDREDLSTPELIRRMAAAVGRSARLLPVPVPLLLMAARVAGQGDAMLRLCGSLQTDVSKAERLLAWRPAVSVDEGLARVAREEGRIS